MRKLWVAALVAAMVLSLVGVAHGEDYRTRALDHLRTKYGSAANKIELHEGGLTRLELTGESFWMAKYFWRAVARLQAVLLPAAEAALRHRPGKMYGPLRLTRRCQAHSPPQGLSPLYLLTQTSLLPLSFSG